MSSNGSTGTSVGPAQLLDALDPQQRGVAETLDGPVAVIAGAGTGKTRAITHRIAYASAIGAQDPARTLAVTFTNRAAGEMTRRLIGLGVTDVRVRTFHSAALRQLRWAWPMAVGGDMHDVIASKIGLVSAAAASVQVGNDTATVRDLATEIEWAKASGVVPQMYATSAQAARRLNPAGLAHAQVASVYARYEQLKRENGKIDFEDVLLLTVGILEERDDLRRTVQKSFTSFTVDEFQDVSGIQKRLLDVWLGDRDSLCVVGDPAQTIYSFAGANPSYLHDFPSHHAGTTVLHLTRCYRCTPEIVSLAESVISEVSTAGDVRLVRRAGAQRQALQSQQEPGPRPRQQVFADEATEAAAVAEQIAGLIANGTPAKEIAILVRINAITEAFESALADAGIPYSVRGGTRYFERPEVRRGVALLRGSVRSDPESAGSPAVEQVEDILSGAGWSQQPPSGTGAVREAWESLAGLVAMAQEYTVEHPAATLSEFVEELARRQEAQDIPQIDGVTIASMHAAKGMEWDAVFVVGLVDGVMPISQATSLEQLDEERRLLYVAITRARKDLSLTWSKARIAGGRPRRPSRFLESLGSGSTAGKAPKKRAARTRGPARCRICSKALVTGPERTIGRCRTCPSDLNEDLFATLKDWRAREVKRQSIERDRPLPAYVIASDATLQALAEIRPDTRDGLAAIPGLGPKKIDQFGDALLGVITEAISD